MSYDDDKPTKAERRQYRANLATHVISDRGPWCVRCGILEDFFDERKPCSGVFRTYPPRRRMWGNERSEGVWQSDDTQYQVAIIDGKMMCRHFIDGSQVWTEWRQVTRRGYGSIPGYATYVGSLPKESLLPQTSKEYYE